MRNQKFIACSFSGGLDELKKKEQCSRIAVLSHLKKAKRFTVFEATSNQTIAVMMTNLKKKGFITVKNINFPWSEVKLTKSGLELLNRGNA